MSAALGPDGALLLADISRRWQAADRLLPAAEAPEAHGRCGAVFTVPGACGRLSAIGGCEHWHGAPESLELSWGAARRYQLTARIGGPDVAAALDALLGAWHVHVSALAGVDDPDSAAVVMWPSRDIDGIRPLLHRGFAPRSVVAARLAGSLPGGLASPANRSPPVPAPSGRHIRRAGPRDVDTVVRLGLEVIRYDAHFGGMIERPSTETALHAEMATLLAEPEPWIWLAERDREPVGVLIAERPPVQWIAPLVRVAPVAYNMLTWVSPADRGTGVAAALVGCFHEACDAAGVLATLLHYEHANPLSAPFWARQGYRPLWTSWEARPACTMR
jgi:GNAT superfamily N-acetyltransferase